MKLEKHFWSTHIINNLSNPIISNVYSYTLTPTITSLFLEGRKHDVGVHSQFVSDCIIQWVTARVIAVWGRVDSVIPHNWCCLWLSSRLNLACVTMSDISIYGFATSLSGLTTYAICSDMFSPVTFRPLVMIKAVISMFCFILCLKLTSASSGTASFSSFVHSRLDAKTGDSQKIWVTC